jgi:hypothetical protein
MKSISPSDIRWVKLNILSGIVTVNAADGDLYISKLVGNRSLADTVLVNEKSPIDRVKPQVLYQSRVWRQSKLVLRS